MRIFVYGSLRKGMYNYELYLKGKSTFIGYGSVKGSLYALKGVSYPALLPGDEDVLGEIYEIQEDVAKAIDLLEGYGIEGKEDDYTKKEVYVTYQNQRLLLPVYFFNMHKASNQHMCKERITCNDYVQYKNAIRGKQV